MTMQYYKDAIDAIHGFDDTDPAQVALMSSLAIAQGWERVSGDWPPAPTAADQWTSYQAAAKAALADTSVTVERIIEAVSLGKTTLTTADVVTFMEYRAALRSIVNQPQPKTIPSTLPVKPPYPANT
ncbi:hypothetical protein [Paludibacterium purpuratum]|uniref:Uncharacterized protein n=1 Tax=Paludibacterium purpuratum TaxID=1144873 RepID=A0A4R7B8S0_9NEIS|nr:hypothetical protein [Paludibacterium purpuratum]TDR79987.1 hypothetical protein DFP86_106127 [Paludibacterium purpuratum]